ncbi:hypothetical protein LTR85_009515 [Meristemomyces frigidus]|nr:hypothetical protein LTR85_009515 [Meristemomyces frigidus]
MHAALTGLALAAGVHAAVTGTPGCCFGLTAAGGPGGYVSQLSDGQNRIGQTNGVSMGTYCLNNGTLTDANGRGCILTPPTGQFQCDTGAHPSDGFALDPYGALTLANDAKFWTCPTGDHGGWNIYSEWLKYQTKCVPVVLHADNSNCNAKPSYSTTPHVASTPATSSVPKAYTSTASHTHGVPYHPPQPVTSSKSAYSWTPYHASKPASSSKPAPTKPPAKPYVSTETDCTTFTMSQIAGHSANASHSKSDMTRPTPPTMPTSRPATPSKPAAPKGSCPAELTDNFEFPHLMVTVDKANEDKAYSNSLNGTVSSTLATVFNFDIPASDAGKQCTLEFLFPTQDTLETSAYTFGGAGKMSFDMLTGPVTKDTTFKSLPPFHAHLGSYTVTPGTATAVSTYPCAAGQKIAFMMSSTDGSEMEYFQDFNPCPIGLYITVA